MSGLTRRLLISSCCKIQAAISNGQWTEFKGRTVQVLAIFASGISGNITFTGNVTATAGQNIFNAYDIDNLLFIDGNKFARTPAGIGAGLTFMSTNPGLLHVTPRTYAFSSSGFTVSHNRQNLLGAGKWATEFDYCGAGTAATFSSGGAATVLYQNVFGGVAFNGACDGTNSNQKIALQPVDTSEFYMHDFSTLNWDGNSGSSTTPSIGVDLQGRELGQLHRVSLSADRPIYIETDPNVASESFDDMDFEDVYMLPQVSTESVW